MTRTAIERRIEKTKAERAGMGEMRPGSLTKQYKDPETGRGPSRLVMKLARSQ